MRKLAILFIGLIAACNSGENFSLRVEFPDQAARDQTVTLEIAIILPTEGASCPGLLDGSSSRRPAA